MKKIVSAVAAGALLAGAAFADVTISANARIYSDALSYTTPTKNGQAEDKPGNGGSGEGYDDNGDLVWGKDTKHADDWTITASGENVGLKVKMAITSPYENVEEASTTTSATTTAAIVNYYNIWANIGKVKLEAGAYDQRLAKNLNIDKNWDGTPKINVGKPGINTAFDGASWGSEHFDIGAISGKTKSFTNVQVSSKELVDGITLHGVVFLNGSGGSTAKGWSINSESQSKKESDPWIFAPFALAAEMKVADGDLKVVGKLNQITQDKKGTDDYSSSTTKPQNSVWTLGADYAKKVGGGTFEAAYTFGASIYTANGKNYGHYTGTSTPNTKESTSQTRLVRDLDTFAHGFDFRWQGKVSDAVTFSALSHIDYIQGNAFARHDAKASSSGTYKDRRALSYATGAAGQLAYWFALGADYKYSDNMTLMADLSVSDTNLFGAKSVTNSNGAKTYVDYWDGLTVTFRPGFQYAVEKSSVVFGGVCIKVTGFQTYADGDRNTVQTAVSVPVGMRIKL